MLKVRNRQGRRRTRKDQAITDPQDLYSPLVMPPLAAAFWRSRFIQQQINGSPAKKALITPRRRDPTFVTKSGVSSIYIPYIAHVVLVIKNAPRAMMDMRYLRRPRVRRRDCRWGPLCLRWLSVLVSTGSLFSTHRKSYEFYQYGEDVCLLLMSRACWSLGNRRLLQQ